MSENLIIDLVNSWKGRWPLREPATAPGDRDSEHSAAVRTDLWEQLHELKLVFRSLIPVEPFLDNIDLIHVVMACNAAQAGDS